MLAKQVYANQYTQEILASQGNPVDGFWISDCLDEGADVLDAPGGSAWAKLDGGGEAAGFHAGPPGRLADRHDGWHGRLSPVIADDLRQAEKAGFGELMHFDCSCLNWSEVDR